MNYILLQAKDLQTAAAWVAPAAGVARQKNAKLMDMRVELGPAPFYDESWNLGWRTGLTLACTDSYIMSWATVVTLPESEPFNLEVSVDAKNLAAAIKSWPKKPAGALVCIELAENHLRLTHGRDDPMNIPLSMEPFPNWQSVVKTLPDNDGTYEATIRTANLLRVTRAANAAGRDTLHHRISTPSKPVMVRATGAPYYADPEDIPVMTSGLIMPVKGARRHG